MGAGQLTMSATAKKPRGAAKPMELAAPSYGQWEPPPGQTLYDAMIQFMESLRIPEGPLLGQPWQLLPYQRKAIRALCDPNVRRIIISIPRKSGKTAFAAALLLATICGPLSRINSQVYSAARSRDQASLVFSLAVKIRNITAWMTREVKVFPSRKALTGLRYNVEYRALAADAQRAHGLSPVLAIHDELGQVSGPSDDLYDAIETAFGAQASPKSIIISTQAAEDRDLLSTLIDDAIAAGDPRTVVILYAADRNDDPYSEATWKKCHPAYGLFRNPEEFREAADRASRMPSAEVAFRRYYLNQRVTGDTGLVTPTIWRANNGAPDASLFMDGRKVYGGLDLSSSQDLTALALVTEDDDGNTHALIRAWTPGNSLIERAKRDRAPYISWRDHGFLTVTPGAVVSYDHVAHDIMSITDGMNLIAIAYDRWRIKDFLNSMEKQGIELPLTPCGQGYRDMSPRVDATLETLLNEKLRHGGNPVLTFAMSSATLARDPAGNRKLDKGRDNGRIDPAQALVMAIGEMKVNNSEGDGAAPIFVM
jgi:phage terminase large subunit-like protein